MSNQGVVNSETTASFNPKHNEQPTSPEARLRQLEQNIYNANQAFVIKGNALRAIHDEKLYLQKYKSFEEYCWECWGMCRQTAYQFINAAKVMENFGDYTDKPANESQARELAVLQTAIEQRYAWRRASEIAQNQNRNLTAAIIKYVVKQMRQKWIRWYKFFISGGKAILCEWIPIKSDRIRIKDTHPQWAGLEGKIVDYYSGDEVIVSFDDHNWKVIEVKYLELQENAPNPASKSPQEVKTNLTSSAVEELDLGKELEAEIAKAELEKQDEEMQIADEIAIGLKNLSPLLLEWVMETVSKFWNPEQLLAVQKTVNKVATALKEKVLTEKEVNTPEAKEEPKKFAIAYIKKAEKEEKQVLNNTYGQEIEEEEQEIAANAYSEEVEKLFIIAWLLRYFDQQVSPAYTSNAAGR